MQASLPLFHPTTTVFIDDDPDIMKLLVKVLNLKNQPHQIFAVPQHGLDHINGNSYRQDLIDRLVVQTDDEELHYCSDAFAHEVFNPDRYNQISVIVIDYDMPGMNGLQVCRMITNPAIKVILLTGAADEKIALDAFNQGLIYQYVRKQDPDFIEHLRTSIAAAQYSYFQEIAEIPVRIMATRYDATALTEPAFHTYFDQIKRQFTITEQYLVESAGSFLLIDHGGQVHNLMVMDDDLIEVYLNSGSGDALTPDAVTAIEDRHLIPCYYDPFHKPNIDLPNLADYLRKPVVISCSRKPYYAVFGQGFMPLDPIRIAFFQ